MIKAEMELNLNEIEKFERYAKYSDEKINSERYVSMFFCLFVIKLLNVMIS